jgi:hypothetical protein
MRTQKAEARSATEGFADPKKGEVVDVAAPRGALKFKILEIKAA